MKNSKPNILFVASFPPPLHGSALMSQYIKDSKLINETFDCDYINLSTSRRIDEIGKSNPIKIWRLFTALMLLMWKLAIKHYDLCYLAITCHGIGFLKDAPFVLLCKLFGRKIIIHQHNKGMSKDVDRRPYKWLMPIVYKNVKVVLLSERLYPDIEKVVPIENVYICPNGIPEVDYEYKGSDNEVPHLLFLSNLMESKGIIVLLDALEIVHDKGLAFCCDIVGAETKELTGRRLSEEIYKRGLRDLIIYHGRKTGTEKERLFKMADVMIHPTLDDCFPLVLLEAMQYGLPIVTTDEGGILDMVSDGVNGLICEKRNPESLAKCIISLISDSVIRSRMGKSSFEIFEKDYTIAVFEKRLKGILDNECI